MRLQRGVLKPAEYGSFKAVVGALDAALQPRNQNTGCLPKDLL